MPALTDDQKLSALAQIAQATIAAIREAGPQGIPGGTLYAAMMSHGATLEQFERFMQIVVASGKVEKRGDLYVAAEG